MSQTICKVIGQWVGADGSVAEVVLDGDEADLAERFAAAMALPEPRRRLRTCLELDTGDRIDLPCSAQVRILPGQQGAVLILPCQDGETEPPWSLVRCPDNAAIVDTQGNIVEILKNPGGKGTSFTGFSGSNFSVVRGEGEVWIAVRSDDPRDYFLSIFRIDGKCHALEKQTRRTIPV